MNPMLAGKFVEEKLRLPVYIQPKYDGIRCLVKGGTAYSRKLKPIPNQFIQEFFAKHKNFLEGYDGELIVGSPTERKVLQQEIPEGTVSVEVGPYRRSMSGVMSESGTPNFTYYVFDHWQSNKPYNERLTNLMWAQDTFPLDVKARVVLTPTSLATSLEDLREKEAYFVSEGYEGAILRHPHGKYKCGRSTTNEGYLLKVKRFLDAEAEIIGFEELYSNQNPAELDALGHTVRSSHKENQRPMGMLGSLQVIKGLSEFNIGSGFDMALRQKIWNNREHYLGKIVKFKYVEVGGYDVPRFPIFLGFRDERD